MKILSTTVHWFSHARKEFKIWHFAWQVKQEVKTLIHCYLISQIKRKKIERKKRKWIYFLVFNLHCLYNSLMLQFNREVESLFGMEKRHVHVRSYAHTENIKSTKWQVTYQIIKSTCKSIYTDSNINLRHSQTHASHSYNFFPILVSSKG